MVKVVKCFMYPMPKNIGNHLYSYTSGTKSTASKPEMEKFIVEQLSIVCLSLSQV